MPLAVPTLTVVDFGDGSSGVATISGSDPASTNVVSVLRVTGDLRAGAWDDSICSPISNSGPSSPNYDGTGDGDFAIIGDGPAYYFVKCQSTLGAASVTSNIPLFNVADNTQSIEKRCMDAVVTRLRLLNFVGDTANDNPGANIFEKFWPDESTTLFPCIFVTFEGEREIEKGGTNVRDDILYPVRVSLYDLKPASWDRPLNKFTLWRQQIYRAFREQRLPGVPEVYTCKPETQLICDPKLPYYSHFITGLLLRFIARDIRGLT